MKKHIAVKSLCDLSARIICEVIDMLAVKQCVCGSTEFEKEIDDDVLRCAECNRLAKFIYVKTEENNND